MSEQFQYDGPETVVPDRYTPGPLDERTERISELSEDFIDRALEGKLTEEPEPVEEPEGPSEEQQAEQAAWAAGRRDETLAGREAQRVLSELAENPRILEFAAKEQEEFYEQALDLIYDDDVDVQGRIEIAKQVAEHAPGRWAEFVEDWQAADPIGPHFFQQQQVAEQNAQARSVYAQQLQEEQAAADRETLAALEGALKGLSRELKDPTRRVDHSPDAAQIVAQMLEQSPPQSPEEARQLVQLARRGTAELGDAREVARTFLGPLDEAIHRQDFFDGDGASYEPQPRSRFVDAATADQIDPDRLLASREPDVLDRGLAGFDAELERQSAQRDEGPPASLVAAQKKWVAERDIRQGWNR